MAQGTAGDTNSVDFYLTAGRGTESFVPDEIRDELSAVNNISTRDGKILFRISQVHESDVHKILTLKSAERAFVTITDYDNSMFIQTKRTFLDKVMQVLSCKENFAHAKTVLQQFSSLLQDVQTNEQKSPQHDYLCIGGFEGDGILTNIKKESNCLQEDPVHIRKHQEKLKVSKRISDKSSSNMSEPAKKMCAVAQRYSNPDCIPEDKKDDDHSDTKFQESCTNQTDQDDGQSCHPLYAELPLTFRMSIKCSGKVRKWINFKKLSRDLGWRVARASGWRVDLRKPNVEVCVHISDDYVTAGVPLTKFPLSKRNYVMDPGLRAPVAWIMYKLANIKTGDVVLDPLCGKATILLEACSAVQSASYLGSDCDSSQINSATQNINISKMGNSVSLIRADSLYMPYRDGCIDVVITDAPFNHKHMICDSPETFYRNLLKEIHRVLRPCGRCVLLTSLELKDMVLSLILSSKREVEQSTCADRISTESMKNGLATADECHGQRGDNVPLIYVSSHYMKLGETHACIIVLNKS